MKTPEARREADRKAYREESPEEIAKFRIQMSKIMLPSW